MTNSAVPALALKGHKDLVSDFCTSTHDFQNGNIAISVSEDQTCRIWDLRTLKATAAIHSFKEGTLSGVKILKNSEQFVVSHGNKMDLFDIRKINTVYSLENSLDSFSFCSAYGEIFDLSVGKGDKKRVIYATLDSGYIGKIDTSSKEIKASSITNGSLSCTSIDILGPNNQVVFGGFDSNINMCSSSISEITHRISTVIDSPNSNASYNPPFVYSICTDPNDDSFLVGLGDGSIMGFYNVEGVVGLDVEDELVNEIGEKLQLSISEERQKYDYSSENTKAYWKTSRWIDAHTYIVSRIEYCGFDPEKAASSGLDGMINIWDATDLVYASFAPDDIDGIQDHSVYDRSIEDTDFPLLASLDVRRYLDKPDWVTSSSTNPIIFTPSSSDFQVYGFQV